MAKVEPMGSHQHETYSQLALQESGENPQPQNVMPVMPMVDIRGKWQEVAVDVLITMCCLLPGIGFLFGCWLLYKYGKLWWQEKSCLDRMGLAYLGFWLVFGPLLTAIHFWRQAQLFSKGHLDLKTIVGSWQINFLLDAIWIGSSLAWLILETNKHQVEQSVCEHKKRNKKILEGPKGNPRAKDLLDTLQGSFPQQFPKDTDIKAGSVQLCSLSGCVLWASTAVIPLLMFAVLMDMAKVHCEIHHPQKCATHLVAETRYIIWIANGVRICLTTLHWKKLMTGVLITTSVHMRMNYCELLLFTALTPSSKGLTSLWSTRNLDTLQEIVHEGSSTRKSHGPEALEWKQQLLRKIQDDQIEEKTIELDSEAGKRDYELDLRNSEDIEAWWLLRQYIQIDFMDELAGAECCGVIIMMLVFAFFSVAVMDWLQNHKPTWALVLVFLLTCALLFAMFELFQACVDINTLWERDNHHTLLDASVVSARREDDHKVTRLLESMRNKVAQSDARQELFGVQVTANLRNAWLLSLVTVFLSTMWEVGKRFMEEADLEKVEDDVRGIIVKLGG